VQGYALTDTIVAPATASAPAGIGMLRISGADALTIGRMLCPGLPEQLPAQQATVTQLRLDSGSEELSDRAVATYWQAPNSYTGEDVFELALHGSPVLMREAVDAALGAGARYAEAGEFTYRAYINGKLDLAQAEAVQDLIAAGSLAAARLASAALAGLPSQKAQGWVDGLTTLLAEIEVIHDYAADDLDASLDESQILTPEQLAGRLDRLCSELEQSLAESRRSMRLREGVTVAICGPPNVGKSTLFNALLGYERALTSPEPGTTRDYVSEAVDSAGLRLTLVDTAGWRDSDDAVEAAGVGKSAEWARAADIVLWVMAADQLDSEHPVGFAGEELPVFVLTRCDLLPAWPQGDGNAYRVSGLTGQGVVELWRELHRRAAGGGEPVLESFSRRQIGCIGRARELLGSAFRAVGDGVPLDAVALDIYAARGELTGVYQQDDRSTVIDQIFSGFCVGK
jgi:tRNA modification GTPase